MHFYCILIVINRYCTNAETISIITKITEQAINRQPAAFASSGLNICIIVS